MAVKTLFLAPDTGSLSDADTGAEATTATGWTVAKLAPTVYSLGTANTKLASGTFGATAVPTGAESVNSGSLFGEATDATGATSVLLNGTFATGTWTLTIKVIAVTSGGDQDGLIRACLYRMNSDGSGLASFATATEGTAVTNLATSAAQTSTVTFTSVAATTFANQILGIEIGWKITGAGGANTRDVLLRKGTGITLVTPDFTAGAAAVSIPDVGMALSVT